MPPRSPQRGRAAAFPLVAIAAAALAAPGSARAAPSAGRETALSIASEDGAHSIHFTALVQADARFFPDDPDGRHVDQFLFRRIDPGVYGTLHEAFAYRLQVAVAGARIQALDAWLELKLARAARLRAGKMIPPVGLELGQSSAAITFAERGLQSNLVPVRDVGVMLSGDLGAISYALALLDGAPDGAIVEGDTSDGKTVVARAFATPFAPSRLSFLHRLGVHAAVSHGEARGSAAAAELPVYRSAGQEVFFSYVRADAGGVADPTRSAIADGGQLRWVAGGTFYRGPLGLLGEWVRSEQRVRLDAARVDARHAGWNVSASWALTGEEASFRGIVPRKRFDPALRTWGAVELAVRANGFSTGRAVFGSGLAEAHRSARRAVAVGAGVNWSLSREVRVTLDYEETRFDGGAGAVGAVRDRPAERTLLGRVQTSL